MTFARFSNSGISLFDHVDHGPVCWNCTLHLDRDRNFFATRDLNTMLAHIAEHRAAGETISDHVEQTLRDEWDEADT